jgi:hypothetical protein
MNKSLAQNSSFTAENQTSGSTPRFTAGDTDKSIASSAFPLTLANFWSRGMSKALLNRVPVADSKIGSSAKETLM